MDNRLAARIDAVDLACPDVDHARVDVAFSTHLDRLGLEPRRVWWANDIASARRVCTVAREAREWWPARARCRAAAQATGWRFEDSVWVEDTQWQAAFEIGRIAAVWDAVEAATRSGEPRRQLFRRSRRRRPDDSLPPNPVAPWLVDAITWSCAHAPFAYDPAVARWTEACTALVEAYQAGLGFFWVLDDWIVAVPRPALSVVDGVLHDEAGPAVWWPGGERYWFWRGLHVPRRVVEEPESLTASEVHGERNLEVRRVMLERMGFDRYMREGGGCVVDEDECGRLWWCDSVLDEPEPLVFVEVENATRDPDGSARRYLLRVPPTMRTPRQAVAWSFGLSTSQYAPSTES